MKKSNYSVKSRELKFEKLENRALLAVDSAIFFGGETTEQSECVTVERIDVEFDDLIPLSAALIERESASDLDSSWYSLVSNIQPTAIEQEFLEQINRLRMDPQGELNRIFSYYDDDTLVARNSFVNDAIKLNSYPRQSISTFLEMWRNLGEQAPLAFNSALEVAANSHSAYMKSRNDISHKCYGEEPLTTRVTKAGFVSGISSNNGMAISENIGGCFSENGSFSIASYMLAAFAVDWGVPTHEHLDAMVNAAYTEVGVSIMQTSKSIGPYIVTSDFGSSVEGARTDGAYLLGVVYGDGNFNLFYDAGEGLSNISITIEQLDSSNPQSLTIDTWNTGGYQVFLLNGSYSVTVSGDGFRTSVTKTVTISDGRNAKLDFRTDEAGAMPPVVDLNGDKEGTNLEVVFVEGSSDPMNLLASSGFSIVDPDSTYLYGAKAYFGSRPDGMEETLDISVAGSDLTATFDDQMGSIIITGVGTVKEYEDVITSLAYFNSSEKCDLSTEHFLFISVYDGVCWSEEAKLCVAIKPTCLPNMTVHETSVYEGDEGSKRVSFVVELDSPARLDVSFNYNVKDGGTAIEGYDYSISIGDPIIIAAGETTATIECYINGNYDALKPEGVKAVDGGFENPFSYFFLEIVELENAFLTNEYSLVKGIIYDDDSPVIIGRVNEYFLANSLTTEEGDRRYIFTISPETSGFYTWNVGSLGLPEGVKISVYENQLDSTPIAESVVVKDSGRVQWFADPSIEYWIKVESIADVAFINARLLEVTDEKVVLVDPILEDSDESLVALMWQNDQLEMSIGSWSWSFDNSFWNDSTIKTTLPDIVFSTELKSGSKNSALPNDDSLSVSFGNELSMSISGYVSYVVSGNDDNEELEIVGTEGNDYLYYSAGYGYFKTSDNKMVSINGVNVLSVDGAGGEDYAYVEDSRDNDCLITSNRSLTMNGGGFKMIASHFSESFIIFNKGGDDVYYAHDSGDDVLLSIAAGSSILTGAFPIESDDSLNLENLSSNNLDAIDNPKSVGYRRTVLGVENTVVVPTSVIGSVILNDNGSSNIHLDVSVGSLQAYEPLKSRSTYISKAKSLTVSGVHPFADLTFNVALPSEYQSFADEDYLSIVDSVTGWELKVPSWKRISKVADVQIERTGAHLAVKDFSTPFFEELQFLPEEEPDVATIVRLNAIVSLLDEGFLFGESSVNNSTGTLFCESGNCCGDDLTLETVFVQDELSEFLDLSF